MRSLAMRAGCLSCFLHPSQTASLSIFFISISLLSYEGSLMFQAIKYPWRMPCGFPCHIKVLNFTVASMPFLIGLYTALGGNRQRCANTKITDLGTPFKVYKILSVPLGQLMPWPHNISGLFPCKGVSYSRFSLWIWNAALYRTKVFICM